MWKHILAIAFTFVAIFPSAGYDSTLTSVSELDFYMAKYLKDFSNLEVAEVLAVIQRESRFRPKTVTLERKVRDKSYGPMQVRLKTARGMGFTGTPEDLCTWREGLYWGMRYLSYAKKVAQKTLRYASESNTHVLRRRMFAIYNSGGVYWQDGVVGGKYINSIYVHACERNYWKFNTWAEGYLVTKS